MLTQKMQELKLKYDQVAAEINELLETEKAFSQNSDTLNENLGPITYVVDNPNKLPMPEAKDSYAFLLGAALMSYKETIRRIQNNEPLETEEELKQRKERNPLSRTPPQWLEASGVAFGIINDINSEKPQPYYQGFIDLEVNTTLAALDQLQGSKFIGFGGSEEIEELLNYLHNWNLSVCTKLIHNGYTTSNLHKKVQDILFVKQDKEQMLENIMKDVNKLTAALQGELKGDLTTLGPTAKMLVSEPEGK